MHTLSTHRSWNYCSSFLQQQTDQVQWSTSSIVHANHTLHFFTTIRDTGDSQNSGSPVKPFGTIVP